MRSANTLSQDRRKLLNILYMYLVSQGKKPKRAKVSYLYPFYSKILDMEISEEDRFIWLMRIGRILERNIHKSFILSKDLFQ